MSVLDSVQRLSHPVHLVYTGQVLHHYMIKQYIVSYPFYEREEDVKTYSYSYYCPSIGFFFFFCMNPGMHVLNINGDTVLKGKQNQI